MLAAYEAMSEMHIVQLVFTSSASGTFIEIKQKKQYKN